MKEPHLSGIASALAAQGRKGDDTLIHVSHKELEALKNMGDGLGIHLTKNPATGLPEAFNWLGALGGVAGGIIGTIIAPGVGTAAGAALGSGLGTAAGGGSTKQSLIAGVLGGITGYAGAGIAGGLADAGAQVVEQGATQGITQGTTQAATQGTTQALADTAGQSTAQSLGSIGTQNAAQTMSQMPALAAKDAGNVALGEGMSKAAGSVVNGSFVPNVAPLQSAAAGSVVDGAFVPNTPAPTYGDKLAAGWDKVTASPSAFGNFASSNAKNLITAGMGLGGIGMMNPTEQSIIQPTTSSSAGYRGESYIDPATGQMRTRAVKLADGGPTFSDYDAADVEEDGGYSPDGEAAQMATGGNTSASSSAGAKGDSKSGIATFQEQGDLPDYMVEGLLLGPDRFKQQNYAMGGGIGNLGSYSDGGRLLKGPGDGVSDNIPATIENKRPARLADGEFVIPARAVSELGNGSTEAGSKQLYKMLDRIAAKRKKGSGLAYQANPQKLMPV